MLLLVIFFLSVYQAQQKKISMEEISDTNYYDLNSDSSVLGKWLRAKLVMITINNIIFVHARISTDMEIDWLHNYKPILLALFATLFTC